MPYLSPPARSSFDLGVTQTRALLFAFTAAASWLGCGGPTALPTCPEPPKTVTISIVGTNDLHGRLSATPILGGYLNNLRAARTADGGGVVLVDGGDMWQGTIESNLGEGAAGVAAYNALGYSAATIGNHEFDYGPVGPRATPAGDEDPRGALLARVQEATFPILSANLFDATRNERVDWPGVSPTALVQAGPVSVGIIGVTTEETLGTTIAANVAGLAMASVAETIQAHALTLRERGAALIVVAAHAGGKCSRFDDPDDLEHCEEDEEIFEVARALPTGLVDVIVGGHTHAGVAHRVNGIAIIESFANGYAFGRVDVVVRGSEVRDVRIFAPRPLCENNARDDGGCLLGRYEGRAVVPDDAILALIHDAVSQAEVERARSLEVTLSAPFRRSYDHESVLGNFLTEMMLHARPDADIALLNGGGLRASLDEGPLTYGALYEAFPFDNRFASVRITGAELTEMFIRNLASDRGVLIVAGVSVEASCGAGGMTVVLRDRQGEVIPRDAELTVSTSDYLATSGTFAQVREARPDAVSIEDGDAMRDVLAEHIAKLEGTLDPEAFLSADNTRVRLSEPRPLRCDSIN